MRQTLAQVAYFKNHSKQVVKNGLLLYITRDFSYFGKTPFQKRMSYKIRKSEMGHPNGLQCATPKFWLFATLKNKWNKSGNK